jgi:hypothetical protein
MYSDPTLDAKIRALIPELGTLRTELQTALATLRAAGNIAGTLSYLSRVTLLLMRRLFGAAGQSVPSDNLYDCIITAARGDPQKRITGLRLLPDEMASYLHTLRTLSNKADHAAERVALSLADAENALNMFVRVLEWYYCEYEYGPRLRTIYGAREASPAITVPPPASPTTPTPLMGRHKAIAMVRDQWLLWMAGGMFIFLITMAVFLGGQAIPGLNLAQPPDRERGTLPPQPPPPLVPVRIDTHPDGFDVYLEDRPAPMGSTPWKSEVRVGSDFKAVLKRKGFKDKEISFRVREHGNSYTYAPEKLPKH